MLLYIVTLLLVLYICFRYNNRSLCNNIAHGCGAINTVKYTNSYDAFYKSYQNGYRHIEIDLLVTKDNHIVGAHDWKTFKKLTNGEHYSIINISYIKSRKICKNMRIIYDEILFEILNKFKDVYIITDKISNFQLLKKYAIEIDRIYIEVLNKKQYHSARKVGFKNIILNIQKGDDLSNILLKKDNEVYNIITVGPNIFYSYKTLLKRMFKKNIRIYVYGVDNITDIKDSFCKYVNGFYID